MDYVKEEQLKCIFCGAQSEELVIVCNKCAEKDIETLKKEYNLDDEKIVKGHEFGDEFDV